MQIIKKKTTILLRARLDCSFLKRVRLQKEFTLFGYFTKPQVAMANNGDHIEKRASTNEPVNLSTCGHRPPDWPVKSSMKPCVTSIKPG